MGYRLNRLDEPVFVTVSKSMQTEFGIHHTLESCADLKQLAHFTNSFSLLPVLFVSLTTDGI